MSSYKIDIAELKKRITPVRYYQYHLRKFSPTANKGWVVTGLCPFHDDNSPGSFSVNLETGSFKCFSCGAKGPDIVAFHRQKYIKTFYEALKEIASKTEMKDLPQKEKQEVIKSQPSKSNIEKIKKVLSEVTTLDSADAEPARKYFVNRGLKNILDDLPQELFFHKNLAYYENGAKGTFPALIAPLRNVEGEIVTIHRTYLTSEGKKAPLTKPKKLMQVAVPGISKGAAMRLYYPTTDTLGLTEGIETALAVRVLTNTAVWATGSSNGLANIELPKQIRKVMIFADNDSSEIGVKNARKAADRLGTHNIKTKILIPNKFNVQGIKEDWLDFLNP